jgi:hypothetical protein
MEEVSPLKTLVLLPYTHMFQTFILEKFFIVQKLLLIFYPFKGFVLTIIAILYSHTLIFCEGYADPRTTAGRQE